MSNNLIVLTETQCASSHNPRLKRTPSKATVETTPVSNQSSSPSGQCKIPPSPQSFDVNRLIKGAKVLCNPESIRLLHALSDGDQMSSSDLAEKSSLTFTNAASRLIELSNNGVVTREKTGRNVFYSLKLSPDDVRRIFSIIDPFGNS